MTVVDVLCLVIAAAALGGWSWMNVATTRALLPQAQAYQALFKLNEAEDNKIRAILAKFDNRPQNENVKKQLEEMARRAQQQGFVLDPKDVAPMPRTAPLPEPPEPLSMDLSGFVDG